MGTPHPENVRTPVWPHDELPFWKVSLSLTSSSVKSTVLEAAASADPSFTRTCRVPLL